MSDSEEDHVDSVLLMHQQRIAQLEMANQWRDDQYLVLRHALADVARRCDAYAQQPFHLARMAPLSAAHASSAEPVTHPPLHRRSSKSRRSHSAASHTSRVDEADNVSVSESIVQEALRAAGAAPSLGPRPETTECECQTEESVPIVKEPEREPEEEEIWPNFQVGGAGPPRSNNKDQPRPDPSEADLSLSWVFGYRTHEKRPNLLVATAGKLVFAVGRVVIVRDHTQQFYFKRHTEEVQTLCVDPTGELCASAQGGPQAGVYVWRISDREVQSHLETGFPIEGVVAMSFGLVDSALEGDFPRHLGIVKADYEHSAYISNWRTHLKIGPSLTYGPDTVVDCGFVTGADGSLIFAVSGWRGVAFTAYGSATAHTPHSTRHGMVPWGEVDMPSSLTGGASVTGGVGSVGSGAPRTPVSGRGVSEGGEGSARGVLGGMAAGGGNSGSPAMCMCVGPTTAYTGHQNGSIFIWETSSTLEIPNCHAYPIRCIAVSPEHLMTCDKEEMRVWTLSSLTTSDMDGVVPLLTFVMPHPGGEEGVPRSAVRPSVCSLSARSETNDWSTSAGWRLAVGCTSGQCFDIWVVDLITTTPSSSRTLEDGTFLLTMDACHNAHGGVGDLWGMSRHPHHRNVVATCGDDGTLRLWDVREHEMKHCQYLPDNARGKAVAFSETDDGKLAVGLDNGLVIIYDSADDNTVTKHMTLRACSDDVFVVKYSPDNRWLAVGSHDANIHIFEPGSDYRLKGKLVGHTSFITAIDMSADSEYLQSSSGANEILYWKLETMEQMNPKEMRDVEWSTWTLPLGWMVRGIWGPEEDGSEVKTVCAAVQGDDRYYVVGDESGTINLYCTPDAIHRNTKHESFRVHSTMILRLSLVMEDIQEIGLVSTAAEDMTMVVWKVNQGITD